MDINKLQSDPYFQGLNTELLRHVPDSAKKILEVGCAEGRLGEALKKMQPDRKVIGIEYQSEIADRARQRLDCVYAIDVEKEDADIEPGTLDCILYGDVIEHLKEPLPVLRKHRKLLKEDGRILCSIPNVQHHSVLRNLLRSDWQYTRSGLLDSTYRRFYTYSTMIKLLLDSGFVPHIKSIIKAPGDEKFFKAAEPLMQYLGLHFSRTRNYLEAYQYIFQGTPLEDADIEEPEEPLSFIVCVNNEEVLNANLLSSPCFAPGSRHEVLTVRNASSAAQGFDLAIQRARHPLVVYLHQDMYLPLGWPARFVRAYRKAEHLYGPLGVAGVCGVILKDNKVFLHAHVVDRHRIIDRRQGLPALIDTLDEVVLAVPRNTPFRFDPALGYHFYGADICLSARKAGLPSVVIDALCFHNTLMVDLNPAFYQSLEVFKKKWASELPLTTPTICNTIIQ
jgi:SAM-dependent methyltransferase